MTPPELVTRVYRQIREDATDPRFTAAKIYDYGSLGLQWLWKEHPEAFMDSTIPTDFPADIATSTATELSTDIPISKAFDMVLVHYVCALCMNEDAEEAANASVSDRHIAQMQGESS